MLITAPGNTLVYLQPMTVSYSHHAQECEKWSAPIPALILAFKQERKTDVNVQKPFLVRSHRNNCYLQCCISDISHYMCSSELQSAACCAAALQKKKKKKSNLRRDETAGEAWLCESSPASWTCRLSGHGDGLIDPNTSRCSRGITSESLYMITYSLNIKICSNLTCQINWSTTQLVCSGSLPGYFLNYLSYIFIKPP